MSRVHPATGLLTLPSSGAVEVKLTKDGSAAVDAALQARVGVARIR
jgi:hypothetical protein